MLNSFEETQTQVKPTRLRFAPDTFICQSDYPLDWYQEEFIPYAEEYQALPDRKLTTILPWMKKYMKPALNHFGDSLLLVAHYYMGGEIVKLVEEFGGVVGDSYQLVLLANESPEKKVIVESAVHFMAESISILAHPDQSVYITNPKSGCTMEMHAKDYMVTPALTQLNERYGKENILPICYMNTSGRIKALTGEQGGATCTSSNVKKIFLWALEQKKKILFIPDKNMGDNVANWVGILPEQTAYWPGGRDAVQFNLAQQKQSVLEQFDRSQLFLFSSLCAVHDYYQREMVTYWQDLGYTVIAHPECRFEVVDQADYAGSTAFIWDHVTNDKSKCKKYAIGTENHMVQNLKDHVRQHGIEVVNLAEAKLNNTKAMGCGCATMSRNDPPHLVGVMDLLRKGHSLDFNHVKPGDVVDEFSGSRTRLSESGQRWIIENAKISLENMIKIVRS